MVEMETFWLTISSMAFSSTLEGYFCSAKADNLQIRGVCMNREILKVVYQVQYACGAL